MQGHAQSTSPSQTKTSIQPHQRETDMNEASMAYLRQTPSGIDAKVLYASALVAPLPQTQFEFDLACVHKMSTSKQASITARLRLTLRRPVVSHSRHKSADLSLNQQLSLSCIRDASSRLDFRSADSINYIHADMGISVPVPAFFVPRHTRFVSLG